MGQKVDDTNCNGRIDTNEPGLPGWTITATNTGSRATVTTVTDATGLYYFNNLSPGTYTISEVLQSGWTQSIPGGVGNYTVTITGRSNPFTVGNQVIRLDFANCKKHEGVGKITGRKIDDRNSQRQSRHQRAGFSGMDHHCH